MSVKQISYTTYSKMNEGSDGVKPDPPLPPGPLEVKVKVAPPGKPPAKGFPPGSAPPKSPSGGIPPPFRPSSPKRSYISRLFLSDSTSNASLIYWAEMQFSCIARETWPAAPTTYLFKLLGRFLASFVSIGMPLQRERSVYHARSALHLRTNLECHLLIGFLNGIVVCLAVNTE